MLSFYETRCSSNYVKAILDEIALEGLDGITPNDLWLRLMIRPNFPLKPSDENVKAFLWDSVKQLREVAFYELPEPRPPLVLVDRFQHIDPILGVMVEPENMPLNIYPTCKIEDTEKNIVGSCSTYHTRTDVTSTARTLSYPEACEKWSHKLAIVASQMARRRALMNNDVNPNLELTVMQYIVLERVGRSRYHGEITQGQDSLQSVGEDAKSLFYLRKVLHKHRLITKQVFHQKLGNQNACGLLLHLPRFFVERKPKALTLIEQIINYLKTKPNYVAEYNTVRDELDMGMTLKKLCKTYNFQKYIKSDVALYRTVYPNADVKDWKYKGANKERQVRVLSLVDPNIEGKDVWQKYDDVYDDDDDEKCGLLDEGQRLLDRTLMSQAYAVLENSGPAGVTQVELGNILGASKLVARLIIRNLQKTKLVTTFMKDEGRQRTSMFALKKFDKCSQMKKQMSEEQGKLIELVDKSSKLSESFKVEPEPVASTSFQNSDSILDSSETKQNVGAKGGSANSKPKPSSKKSVKNKQSQVKESETDVCVDVLNKESELQKTSNETLPVAKKEASRGKKRKASESAETVSDKQKPNKKKKSEEKIQATPAEDEVCAKSEKSPQSKGNSPSLENESNEVKAGTSFEKEQISIEVQETKPNKKFIGKSLMSSRFSIKPGDTLANSVSFRLLKRTNIIMETVNKQQVIFDTSKLSKLIQEEESKEGYLARMDKKSLLRIINKLADEGHLKYLTITLRAYKKEKVLHFICHPSVPNDHSVIQSAVDQAKMKFHILGKDALKKKGVVNTRMKQVGLLPEVETLHLNEVNPEEEFNLKYNQTMGRVYGFKPKYMRMQVLHKYMFYLIYGYDGNPRLDQEQAVTELRTLTTITDDVKAEMSQVYSTSALDYKIFLPPLPEHSGYNSGWALMSDLLLRMPLSLFVQVVNVMYELPELEEYLNHPIKKHFLVKNLPLKFRNTLTYARKYIFTLHELVTRLCCSGLIQLGPQRLKEKDQVFVYLNRKAILWDTTLSQAGYHQISAELEYPVHLHHFGNMSDVEQYWHDLWNYCMHTMLGGRMCMGNTSIVMENYQTKPELTECMEPRGVEEAPQKDVGYLPGDHKGAAGFDSCTFPHLKRNWYWSTTNTNQKSLATANAPTTDLQPVVFRNKASAGEKRIPIKSAGRVISETSSARRKFHRQTKVSSNLTLSVTQRNIKKLNKKTVVRMLKQRIRGKRRPYYDQVDKEALLKMSKLRVDWSSKEDNILLLCKVATLIIQAVGKKCYQNLIGVRQILHEQCPKATDKTSRACQRRITYMMKNQKTQRSVNLCVEEMKQDAKVINQLKNAKEVMDANSNMSQADKDKEWNKHFCMLVNVLQDRYKRLHAQELSTLSEGFVLPDTAQELLEKYRVLRPEKLMKKGFNDVHSITDIHAGVINATILSALNCVGDKTSWSYQLFSIYQQYPDKLMRSVMAKTRKDQMISMRKHYLRTSIRTGDYLPLSSTPYQLSINYMNLLLVRYQYDLYGDCLKMYQDLKDGEFDDNFREVLAAKGGTAAAIVEFASQDKIDFKIEIPDQIIVMDPNVTKKDESYTRIVKRYQDILAKCKEKNQITITAVFDEAYNTQGAEGSDDDEEEDQERKVNMNTSNTVAKAASRIALFFNRDERDVSKSSAGDTRNELQHAHDFFLVNSCRVFCQLRNKEDEVCEATDSLNSYNEKVEGIIHKIKRLATLPAKVVDSDEIIRRICEDMEITSQFVEEILQLIKSKAEFGVSISEIKDVYGLNVTVAKVLSRLVDGQLVLRVGINKTVWVHVEYHVPWVIRSYQLVRLEKEKLVDPSHSNYSMVMSIGDGSGDHKEEDEEKGKMSDKDKEDNTTEPCSSLEATPLHDAEPSEAIPSTSHDLHISSKTCTDTDPDISNLASEQTLKKTPKFFGFTRKVKRITPSFNNKFKCDLNVCVRPWIRINGTLNRRVLDKFLTSVLGHIMMFPLCSMLNTQQRFTPAFQPHHTRELVEILEELGCLKMLALKRSVKTTLFSKPSQVSTGEATGLESEADLLLEPHSLAITRLSLFINDSSYQRDFFAVNAR